MPRQISEGSETCLRAEKLGAVAPGPGHSLAIRPHVTDGLSYLLGNRLEADLLETLMVV